MAKAKETDNEGRKANAASKRGGRTGEGRAHKQLRALEAAEDTSSQPCLTLTQSAFIVGGCLPSGSHNSDQTLEEAGLITDNLRLIFRECVFNGVRQAGCDIHRSDIPNGADTKIFEVVVAVQENSSRASA
ncbi:MAG TPA: hypothetical protein VJ464_15390 [Blastocatellia bacterium]|nr:hypothetical protein [Blastocatellia bacterium]